MPKASAPDGTEIAYSINGPDDASTVILVHGITESAKSWDPITERLATGHSVVTIDLRGHGASGSAESYDLEAMAGDVVAVAQAEDLSNAHLVGHSLGGAVVSAVGAVLDVSSVVNVDQSLQLGDFKANLEPVEARLRDPATFDQVIEGIFTDLAGNMLSAAERARLSDNRRPDQHVVLGVWESLFTMSESEIASVVESALAGYAGSSTPYLALFGIDPGPEYGNWLQGFISEATVETWADHGHYPHLVDPDRFVARIESFWAQTTG